MKREEVILLARFLETYKLKAEELIKTLAVLAKTIDGWGETDTHYEAYKLCEKRSDDNNSIPSDEDYAAAIVKIVTRYF